MSIISRLTRRNGTDSIKALDDAMRQQGEVLRNYRREIDIMRQRIDELDEEMATHRHGKGPSCWIPDTDVQEKSA